MKRNLPLYIILVLLTLLPTLPGYAQSTPVSRVIVLCDVSNSIAQPGGGYQNRLAEIGRTCSQLLRHYPHGSSISFYFINSNAAAVPFVRFDAPVVKQRSAWQVEQQLESLEKAISTRIDSAAHNQEKQTCILTSVENACDNFAAESVGNNLPNVLIIFSDLLEQCHATSVGKIWMNDKGTFLTKAELSAIGSYQAKPAWQGLHIQLQVVNISGYMSIGLKNSIQIAWTTLFRKMGLLPQSANQFLFLSALQVPPCKEYKKPF